MAFLGETAESLYGLVYTFIVSIMAKGDGGEEDETIIWQ